MHFQIRNRLREIEGTYSKKEILALIEQGRFHGDEEIAPPPYDRWQKIAAHPTFYDAFLKRLYAEGYRSPDPKEKSAVGSEVSSPKEKREKEKTGLRNAATHQGELPSSRPDPEGSREGSPKGISDSGKTSQIPAAGTGFGVTLHQSELDALFRDEKKEDGGAGAATGHGPPPEAALSSEPFADRALTPVPLDQPLVELPPLASPAKISWRRKLFWSGTGIGLLFLLFKWGGSEPKELPKNLLNQPPGPGREALNTSASREEIVATLLDEAESLERNDTALFYEGALEVLREALSYSETSVNVLGKFAQVAARTLPTCRDRERRLAEIQQAIERGRRSDPHFSQFYRAEALVSIFQNKLDLAKQSAVAAAETDPTSSENYLLVAELYVTLGDVASARTALEEALKVSPTNLRAQWYLALVAHSQREDEVARTHAVEALKLNPLHPQTFLLLGDIAEKQKQMAEAEGLYETCGKLARFVTPVFPEECHLRLGKIREAAGNSAGALEEYRLAYAYRTSSKIGAEVKAKLAGKEPTPEEMSAAVQKTEYGPAYFQEQGEGLLGQGKVHEAVRFFQAAQLLSPGDGMALIRLGEVAEKTATSYDDFRRVMVLYQRAIEKDPKEAMGYIKLGTLETEQYNFERGYKLLTQGLALAPDVAEPYTALGKHYYKRQDYNEALNQFLKAAKLNPSDSEVLYYAGLLRLLFKKEGMRDSVRFFYQAYTLNPQNYDALVEWLKLKVVGFEKNFAIKFMRNLLEADPKNPQLYWAMGEIYAASKEYRRAIGFYHQSLDLDNRASKVRMSLGTALEAVGELDKAVAEYRLASLLDRRNSEGFFKAADLLFQMKNYNQAEEVLKFLVNVTPNYPGAHRYLSKIYQLRKQKDLALSAMQKEVANNPENNRFVLELAELYMEQEKFDEAISELTKVTNLPPQSKAPEYAYDRIRGYLLLSRCYRVQNKLESAESAVRLALEIDANDPELHRELGYVYYAEQRDKEGVKAFEFYLNRNPAARDAEAIKGLIQNMMIEE